MSDTPPAVSVIIVNWNGARFLPRCLASLTIQNFSNFEVILVDNNSTDNSWLNLQDKWPQLQLRVERLDENKGFAAANNIGGQMARGHWLALLNADAFPTSTWLENLVRAAQTQTRYSFFASRILQADRPELIDGLGDVYHISGLAWRRYHNCPATGLGLTAEEVFSPCAAAAMYTREDFNSVAGFDQRFGSYHEDVDLGFRLRLRGQRCLYVPEAVVYHVGSASVGPRSDFVVYHGHRNLVWCFVQNMPGPLFWRSLPAHLVANLLFAFFYTLRGQGQAIWKAKLDALAGLPTALNRRRSLQSSRIANPSDLEHVIDRNWLSPYLGAQGRKKSELDRQVST